MAKAESFSIQQVLAATQTPGEAGKMWFQGTADAVRQFIWVFEVCAAVDRTVFDIYKVIEEIIEFGFL